VSTALKLTVVSSSVILALLEKGARAMDTAKKPSTKEEKPEILLVTDVSEVNKTTSRCSPDVGNGCSPNCIPQCAPKQ